MRLTDSTRVHLVGITGAGLSSLAAFLRQGGTAVTGSDLCPGPLATPLREIGVQVRTGHRDTHVDFNDGFVVASAAIPADNPELTKARRRGVPVLKYSEVLGMITRERPTYAIAGTHGKTSTCGLAVHALRAGGLDPGYILGGTLVGESLLGGMVGKGEHLVVEACEYDHSFLQLSPRIAVVLNVEPDHFDCYAGPDAMLDAYRSFLDRLQPGGLVILHQDAKALAPHALEREMRLQVVGEEPDSALRAVDLQCRRGCWSFTVLLDGGRAGRVGLHVPGRHMIGNALAALALVREAGGDLAAAAAGLGGYRGMRRRFEIGRGPRGGVVVSDYAHHPTELEAVLDAGCSAFPERRRVALFQPHQYSRTRALLDDFARVLSGFDRVLLTDIYAARDSAADRAAVASADLAAAICREGGEVTLVGPAATAGEAVLELVDPERDALLVLGAGDVVQLVEPLRQAL